MSVSPSSALDECSSWGRGRKEVKVDASTPKHAQWAEQAWWAEEPSGKEPQKLAAGVGGHALQWSERGEVGRAQFYARGLSSKPEWSRWGSEF